MLGGAIGGNETAGMQDEPKCGEIGEELLLEDPLQIGFEEGRAGHAGVVPQQAQRDAVGNDAPKRYIFGIKEFLHQAVRRTALAVFTETGGALVEQSLEGRKNHRHAAITSTVGERERSAAQIGVALDRFDIVELQNVLQ